MMLTISMTMMMMAMTLKGAVLEFCSIYPFAPRTDPNIYDNMTIKQDNHHVEHY